MLTARVGFLGLVGAAFALFAGSGGCAPGNTVACHLGSDCASGVCDNGLCVDPGTTSSSSTNGTTSSASGTGGHASTSTSTGSQSPTTTTGTGGANVCSPNHDGVITRDEVPLAPGLSAKFEVATNATFSTSGTPTAGGKRDWNMAGSFNGDHLDIVETMPITGSWYASNYAGATYAAKLSDSSDLLGVFEITNDALLLRGVVSPMDGPTKTELVYNPPVPALQFPLAEQKTWTVNSAVTGYAQGVIVSYAEGYEFAVDASGTLETPFGMFDVLRVKSTLTRNTGFLTVIRSFSFAAECFGTVASVTSQNDEPNVEFSNVAELRRLSP